jgi:site-specific recombinase XerD
MTQDGDPTPQPVVSASALPSDADAAARRPPAAETVRLYASDWTAFVRWCPAAARAPLPADPDTITAYLASLAETMSYGTLMRRLAAIAHQHRQHGLAAPAIDPTGKALLRAVRGAAVPRRRPQPASGLLARMATTCPGDLAGLRDRALLLLAAGTGLGRTALVSLDAQRVALVAGGWPPIRWHRARSAAQPRFVAVVRRDIRALIASFR